MKSEVKKIIEYLGAKRFRRGIDWNGYEVYIPIYKNCPIIGLPYVVLKNEKETRLSTEEECLEYLDYSLKSKNSK